MGGTNAKDSSPIGAGKGDGIVEEQDEESANAFACNFSTLTSTIGSLMLVNRLVYTKISQDSTVWVRLSRNILLVDGLSGRLQRSCISSQLPPSSSSPRLGQKLVLSTQYETPVDEERTALLHPPSTLQSTSRTRAKELFRDALEATPERKVRRKAQRLRQRLHRRQRVFPLFKFFADWAPWEIIYFLSALAIFIFPPLILDGWLSKFWLSIPLLTVAGHAILSALVCTCLTLTDSLPMNGFSVMVSTLPSTAFNVLQRYMNAGELELGMEARRGIRAGAIVFFLSGLALLSIFISAGLRALPAGFVPFLVPFWVLLVPIYAIVPITASLLISVLSGTSRTVNLLFLIHFFSTAPFAFLAAFSADGLFNLPFEWALYALHAFVGSFLPISLIFYLLFRFKRCLGCGFKLSVFKSRLYLLTAIFLAIFFGTGYWTTTWIPFFLLALPMCGGWIYYFFTHPAPFSLAPKGQLHWTY